MNWSLSVISVFVVSVVFAGLLIPQILLVAFKKNLFDEVNERKIHKGAVPRLGGIAFLPVLTLSISLLLGVTLLQGNDSMLDYVLDNMLNLSFLICSAIVLYLVGLADDLIGVKYRAKFVVQISCGVMLLVSGLYVGDFHGVFLLNELPYAIAAAFTVLLVVFVVNAINLIDGIDGLASGLSSVALFFYGIVFFVFGEYLYSVIAFATLGTVVPFFYFNVFGDVKKRKKIFMGDTGSLSIGLILCFLALKLSQSEQELFGEVNPMIMAFVPLFVPCMDVVRVFFGRLRRGVNPFNPDKTHLHHKIMAIGITPRVTMILILLFAVLSIAINVLLSIWINATVILVLDILAWIMLNIVLSRFVPKQDDGREA